MLSDRQVADFHAEGFLLMRSVFQPEQMAAIKRVLMEEVLAAPSNSERLAGLEPDRRRDCWRNLDRRLVHDLACQPAILATVAQLLGLDLVLFKTQFFDKPAYGPAIPWHQDSDAWPLERGSFVSVWLAIDDAAETNGCLRIVRRSHRRSYASKPIGRREDYWPTFETNIPLDGFAASDIVNCELAAGAYCVMADVVHGSNANLSSRPRLGLVCRYAKSDLVFDHEAFFPGHANTLVGGRGRGASCRLLSPPENGASTPLDQIIVSANPGAAVR